MRGLGSVLRQRGIRIGSGRRLRLRRLGRLALNWILIGCAASVVTRSARRGTLAAQAAADAAQDAAEAASATAAAAKEALAAMALAETSAAKTAAAAKLSVQSAQADLADAQSDEAMTDVDEAGAHQRYQTAAGRAAIRIEVEERDRR